MRAHVRSGCQIEKVVNELNPSKKIISCYPSNLPPARSCGLLRSLESFAELPGILGSPACEQHSRTGSSSHRTSSERRSTSFELSQSSAVGTSASVCSSQYTSITQPEWGWPHPWFSALMPNSHLVVCRIAIPSPSQYRIPPHG